MDWKWTLEHGWRREVEVIARAVGAQFGYARTGSEQAAVEFRVLSKGQLEGTNVVAYLSFAGGALEFTLRQLETCGWSGSVADTASICRNKVRLVLEITERDKYKVKWIYPEKRELVKNELTRDAASELERRIADAKTRAREQVKNDDGEWPGEPGQNDLPY